MPDTQCFWAWSVEKFVLFHLNHLNFYTKLAKMPKIALTEVIKFRIMGSFLRFLQFLFRFIRKNCQ